RAVYQVQDGDRRVRLAKKYDFGVQNEKLYRFRLRKGHVNLSGPQSGKIIRTRNEFYLLMRNFFDGLSMDVFKETFCDLLSNRHFSTPIEFLCEQAFVMTQAPTATLRLVG